MLPLTPFNMLYSYYTILFIFIIYYVSADSITSRDMSHKQVFYSQEKYRFSDKVVRWERLLSELQWRILQSDRTPEYFEFGTKFAAVMLISLFHQKPFTNVLGINFTVSLYRPLVWSNLFSFYFNFLPKRNQQIS